MKKDRISEAAAVDLTFLDDSLDNALLGYAVSGGRGRYVLPCYGYQVIKSVLLNNGYSGADMYARLRQIYAKAGRPYPLILTKMSHKALWEAIANNNYVRWEQLDKAILGIGKIGSDITGIVYSAPLCIDILTKTSSTLRSEEEKRLQAIRFFEEGIMPLSTPKYTPWYLTPVK